MKSRFERIGRDYYGGKVNDIRLAEITEEYNKEIFNGAVVSPRTLGERLFERAQFTELKFNKVQVIPRECFKNSSITSLKLGDSLMKIEESAFENCTMLKEIVLEAPLKNLGANCFKNCLSLESVELPISLKSMHPTSFEKCNNLKTISIEFKEEYSTKFSNWFNFESNANFDFPIEQEKFLRQGLETLKQLRSLRDHYPNCSVNYMGTKQFPMKDIDEIIKTIECEARPSSSVLIIEEGREVIKKGEFANNESITEVVLPRTLRVIEESAFELCTSLKKITVQSMLNRVDAKAFGGCISLEVIETKSKKFNVFGVLPARSIGNFAFYKCLSLKRLKLLSVATLGEAVFKECRSLESVDVAGPLSVLPRQVFDKCVSLKQITFTNPELIETIGDRCFCKCFSLEKVPIENFTGLRVIDNNAFESTNLKSFCYDGEYLLLKDGCFCYCDNLNVVSIKSKSSLIVLKSTFLECINLNSFIAAAPKVRIDDYCFSQCYNLRSIRVQGKHTVLMEQTLVDSKGFDSLIIESKTLVWCGLKFYDFQSISLIDLYNVEKFYSDSSFQKEDFEGDTAVDLDRLNFFGDREEITFLELSRYLSSQRYYYRGTPLSLIVKVPKTLREVKVSYESGFNCINELWVHESIRVVLVPSINKCEEWGTNTDLQTIKVVNNNGNFSRLWIKEVQLLDEYNPNWVTEFRASTAPFKDLVMLEVSPDTLLLASGSKVNETQEFTDDDFEGLF